MEPISSRELAGQGTWAEQVACVEPVGQGAWVALERPPAGASWGATASSATTGGAAASSASTRSSGA